MVKPIDEYGFDEASLRLDDFVARAVAQLKG